MKKLVKKSCFFIVAVICFSLLSFVYSGIAKATMANFNGYTIVIDAGHGGFDVK